MNTSIEFFRSLYTPSDKARELMVELGVQPQPLPAYVEQIIEDSGDTIGYIAKDWVSAEEFQAGVHWLGHEEVEIIADKLKYTTTRKIPAPWSDEFDLIYQIPTKPGPGAYEATVYYLE